MEAEYNALSVAMKSVLPLLELLKTVAKGAGVSDEQVPVENLFRNKHLFRNYKRWILVKPTQLLQYLADSLFFSCVIYIKIYSSLLRTLGPVDFFWLNPRGPKTMVFFTIAENGFIS
jgi:hypothetical protein